MNPGNTEPPLSKPPRNTARARLRVSHGLLQEDPLDEFAEFAFPVLDIDDVLHGCRAGWRIEADASERHIPHTSQEIAHAMQRDSGHCRCASPPRTSASFAAALYALR